MSHISNVISHMASGYHVQCRYKTLSSLQKIVLNRPLLGYFQQRTPPKSQRSNIASQDDSTVPSSMCWLSIIAPFGFVALLYLHILTPMITAARKENTKIHAPALQCFHLEMTAMPHSKGLGSLMLCVHRNGRKLVNIHEICHIRHDCVQTASLQALSYSSHHTCENTQYSFGNTVGYQ